MLPLVAEGKSGFLYLDPSEKSFEIGGEFSVSLRVGTDFPINAVKTVLYFPKDKLSVEGVSKQDSIFTLWPEEPKFSNESGEITFLGGLPHPGFVGTDGQILSIKFKAKDRGVAELNFGETAILASDGKGTNIFSYAKEGKYTLNFPVPIILSNTHPNEDKWYQDNNPEFSWKLVNTIIGVSFILDKNSTTEPDDISEGKLDSQIYQEINDGVWYFHLKAKDNLGWSSTRHLTIHIDTTPPSPFEIVVNNEGDPTNPRPILYFDVHDEISGIDYYRINFETGDSVILANPGINQYQLPLQGPGTHQIVVQAFDKAGNFRENITGIAIKPIEQPILTIWPRIYVSGEEIFYTEGNALPKSKVMLFLEKDNKVLREWQTSADEQGLWKFSSDDLLKAGIYYLYSRAKDYREAVSEFSPKEEIKVMFSGLAIGSFLLTFRNLVLILIIILLIFIGLAIYSIHRILKAKKRLKKETKEAKESLSLGFGELRKNIKEELEKLERVKSERELDEKEKEFFKNLKEDLEKVEKFIGKEIKDVEEELK